MKLKPYIITLNDVTDKVNDLNRVGIQNIEIVQGVLVKNTSVRERREALHSTFYNFVPNSVAGCAMAHMNVWKKFLQDNRHEYALIMEDDVVIKSNKNIRDIYNALEMTPSTFDILYLGCIWCKERVSYPFFLLLNEFNIFKKYPKDENINQYIKKPSSALGLHCYILSKKGARTLLNHLYGKIYNHIDFHINKIAEDINIYSVIDIIATQTSVTNETSSENNTLSSHPAILHYFVKDVNMTDNLKLGYFLKLKGIKVFNAELNITSLIFLIIGVICSLLPIQIEYLIVVFILLSLKDLIDDPRNEYIYIHFILFIFPSLCKKLITVGRLK